eukprot:1419537-Pyramimonas_sp.AAC.1
MPVCTLNDVRRQSFALADGATALPPPSSSSNTLLEHSPLLPPPTIDYPLSTARQPILGYRARDNGTNVMQTTPLTSIREC